MFLNFVINLRNIDGYLNARIQTFLMSLFFSTAVIGNTVPVKLAEAIAVEIKNQFFK